MKLSEARAELARRFGGSDDKKFRDQSDPAINLAYKEVAKSWDWKELETSGAVTAIPVLSGTVTLSNGSFSVTLPSAPAADYLGGFFRKNGGENEYQVVYINGAVITLNQAIVEDTGSVDFELEKRYYLLPTEVRKIIGWENKANLIISYDHQGLRQHMPNYDNRINDVPFSLHGSDNFTADYSTGAVSVSANSPNLITWSATAWLGKILPGWNIRFNSVDYKVRRVESDTRIISYNRITATENVPYVASKGKTKTLRLRAEFSSRKIIPFTYIRQAFNLIHQDDETELLDEADQSVLAFAQTYLDVQLKTEETQKAQNILVAQARLQTAQGLSEPARPAFKKFPPLVPRGHGRG